MTTPTFSSLRDWRDHARAVQDEGQWNYDVLWRPLAPFFEKHGYSLWVRIAMEAPCGDDLCRLGPPNSQPRAFDGYSYSSPYSLNNEDTKQRRQRMQQMSPVICPARTAQNHDVMIRLVAVGSFGDKHSRALDRLGTPELTFLPQNHSLPILDRIVYENQYHFAVFPMMEDVQSLPDFHDYVEAVDYIEQLVEGLNFLHERSISHGDICKENILVNFVGPPLCTLDEPLRSRFPVRYYYTDLEFTTCPDEGESAPSAQGSPMSWSDRGGVYSRPSAPELSKPEPYSPFQADVWQLGHLLNEEFEEFPHFDGYQQLFKNMMKEDPTSRPSLNEVLTEVRRLKLDVHPIRGLPSDRSATGWGGVFGLLGYVRGWWNVSMVSAITTLYSIMPLPKNKKLASGT